MTRRCQSYLDRPFEPRFYFLHKTRIWHNKSKAGLPQCLLEITIADGELSVLRVSYPILRTVPSVISS